MILNIIYVRRWTEFQSSCLRQSCLREVLLWRFLPGPECNNTKTLASWLILKCFSLISPRRDCWATSWNGTSTSGWARTPLRSVLQLNNWTIEQGHKKNMKSTGRNGSCGHFRRAVGWSSRWCSRSIPSSSGSRIFSVFRQLSRRYVSDSKSNVFHLKKKKNQWLIVAGVRYLDGGVASGFRHVDPEDVEKKLLQVKGKRNVRVRQVHHLLNHFLITFCRLLGLFLFGQNWSLSIFQCQVLFHVIKVKWIIIDVVYATAW